MRQLAGLASALALVFFSGPSYAQRSPERSVGCAEGDAVHLSYGDHTTGCQINYEADLDQFTFQGTASDEIRIVLKASGPNAVLEIRDPFNTPLPSGGIGENNRTLQETGTYTLRIWDNGFNQTGTYTLQLELLGPVDWGAGLRYDRPRTDDIQQPLDHDFFKFLVRAGTEVRLIIIGSPSYDARLEVLRPDGSFVTGNSCGSSGPPCSFFLDIDAADSGPYFAVMTESGYDEPGSFEVSLQCLFGDCPLGYYIENLHWISSTEVAWNAASDPDATYNVVQGDLDALRSSTGNYASSVLECVSSGNVLPMALALDDPSPGQGLYYVARAVHSEIGIGSYDSAQPGQLSRRGGRDSGPMGISSSPNACSEAGIVASFVPGEPNPGSNTVSMFENATDGDLATIDITATDIQNVFGATFDVVFDPSVVSFVSWAPGELLEQGSADVNYQVAQGGVDRIVVGATRTGSAGGTDAVGSTPLIRLTFRVVQVGASGMMFENQALVDDQSQPQAIPGLTWFGGTLAGN